MPERTCTNEDLVKYIVGYHSSFTEADARVILTILNEAIIKELSEGNKEELPFGYAYLNVKET